VVRFILTVLLATAASCVARPLPYAGGGDAAISRGDALADDGAPAACTPANPTGAFALCGVVAGKPVRYAPPYLAYDARGLSEVDFEVLLYDGVWMEVWGLGAWRDHDPHQVSGWLLRPPADWAGRGAWICGREGTITHNADDSIDGNLGQLAILPACDSSGGPQSLHVDVTAGVYSLLSGGQCQLAFLNNGTSFEILTPSCPHVGVPLALDGLRLVNRGTRGMTSDATACIGAGATVTSVPDVDASSVEHLVIDIPSMSALEPCAPATSGGLLMHVAPLVPADAGP